MQIVAALFIENIELKPAPGPSTRIDLSGIHFSRAAEAAVPCTVAPHLVVIVHCPPEETGSAALEVTYHRDGEQIARNVQPLQVEPGKFNYRLVRAELEFAEYGAVQAHIRLDLQEPMVVPFTLLPPVEGEAAAPDELTGSR